MTQNKRTVTGYKWLTADGKSVCSDCLWRIGVWKHQSDDVVMCRKGYHACPTLYDSLEYVYGPRLFLVEARGKIISEGGKFVAQEMRILRELPAQEIVRDFLIAVLKNSLFRFELAREGDMRPRAVLNLLIQDRDRDTKADAATELTAWKKAEADAWAAAEDVAETTRWAGVWAAAEEVAETTRWAAAWAIAWATARAAACATSWMASRVAAWEAAEAASRAAAGDTASSVARHKEQVWQRKKLDAILRRWS